MLAGFEQQRSISESTVISLIETANQCRRSIASIVSPLSSTALSFIYPPECLMCGAEITGESKAFCDGCVVKLKPVLTNECPRCGNPVGPYADLSKGCGQCRKTSFAFERVIRLGTYDNAMRQACLRAKAAGGSNLSRGLADALVNEKRRVFDGFSFDLVVPVPEHWTRRVLHPHYAAETISRQISRRLGVRWNRTVLLKHRRTPKQATSPTTQRRIQQHGSFVVRQKETVSDKIILLVDDILTTGSTADAAARTLIQAGARSVVVAVVAVSPLQA
jgi:predicted amidophosphoribosyltransferase